MASGVQAHVPLAFLLYVSAGGAGDDAADTATTVTRKIF